MFSKISTVLKQEVLAKKEQYVPNWTAVNSSPKSMDEALASITQSITQATLDAQNTMTSIVAYEELLDILQEMSDMGIEAADKASDDLRVLLESIGYTFSEGTGLVSDQAINLGHFMGRASAIAIEAAYDLPSVDDVPNFKSITIGDPCNTTITFNEDGSVSIDGDFKRGVAIAGNTEDTYISLDQLESSVADSLAGNNALKSIAEALKTSGTVDAATLGNVFNLGTASNGQYFNGLRQYFSSGVRSLSKPGFVSLASALLKSNGSQQIDGASYEFHPEYSVCNSLVNVASTFIVQVVASVIPLVFSVLGGIGTAVGMLFSAVISAISSLTSVRQETESVELDMTSDDALKPLTSNIPLYGENLPLSGFPYPEDLQGKIAEFGIVQFSLGPLTLFCWMTTPDTVSCQFLATATIWPSLWYTDNKFGLEATMVIDDDNDTVMSIEVEPSQSVSFRSWVMRLLRDARPQAACNLNQFSNPDRTVAALPYQAGFFAHVLRGYEGNRTTLKFDFGIRGVHTLANFKKLGNVCGYMLEDRNSSAAHLLAILLLGWAEAGFPLRFKTPEGNISLAHGITTWHQFWLADSSLVENWSQFCVDGGNIYKATTDLSQEITQLGFTDYSSYLWSVTSMYSIAAPGAVAFKPSLLYPTISKSAITGAVTTVIAIAAAGLAISSAFNVLSGALAARFQNQWGAAAVSAKNRYEKGEISAFKLRKANRKARLANVWAASTGVSVNAPVLMNQTASGSDVDIGWADVQTALEMADASGAVDIPDWLLSTSDVPVGEEAPQTVPELWLKLRELIAGKSN